MIKLLAIDLDGTLYTTDRKITDTVMGALKRAVDHGIQLAIVTGRGKRGAEIALESLGMDMPYICSAGALLRSGLHGDTIEEWTFHEHQEMLQVIDFSRKTGIGLIAELSQSAPYWFGSDSMMEILDPLTAEEVKRCIRTLEPEVDFDRPMLKVTITADLPHLAEVEKLVRSSCPSLHQVYAGIHYIDLTASGVNKGTALAALAKKLKIKPSEIAAIGDQEIDFQMLNYSGFPIAMANSVPTLFEIAKLIAPSNDENGVAWAIDAILDQSGYNINS